MKKIQMITMILLVCTMIIGHSISAYAGGGMSSMSRRSCSEEQIVLNNPVDADWVQKAEKLANDLNECPFATDFENCELNALIKKTENAMHSYTNDCGYDYGTLLKINRIFENALQIRAREYAF